MSATENVIKNLNTAKLMLRNSIMLNPEMCVRIGQTITNAIDLLTEQKAIVRCKDCIWYDQRDGQCEHHICINNTSPDWYCADGERKEKND